VYGVTRAWRDEATARRALLLLALFPSSLFLWTFYTEGLFIALSAGALWADHRRHRWLTVVLLAGVAATRPVGIGVAGVVVLAHILRERRVNATTVLYAVGGACGLGAVMVQQWRQMGDPLAFADAQKYWHRKLDFPWASIREGLGSLKSGNPRPVKVLDLVAIAIVVVCVFYALRLARSWPYEAWMLPIVVVGVPLCGPYLSSMSRFLLSAWPVFSIGGEALGRAPRVIRYGWYVASGLLAIVFARYWAHGDFIG
jgi:Gpi18-like mannosyltransferase